MKMWIARAMDNSMCIFREKPFLLDLPELICPIWVYETQLNTGNSWRNVGENEIGGPYHADIYTEGGYAGYVHKACVKYEEALSEGIKEAVKILKENEAIHR